MQSAAPIAGTASCCFDVRRAALGSGRGPGDRGGTPQLTWTIDYLGWPGLGDHDRMRLVRDMTLDDVEFDHEDYDVGRWPVWREWAAGAGISPSRALAIERLQLLGVTTSC